MYYSVKTLLGFGKNVSQIAGESESEERLSIREWTQELGDVSTFIKIVLFTMSLNFFICS